MNPIDLMVEIIQQHNPENIWLDSRLMGYRLLGNTNRGEIGEEFVRRYLRDAGMEISHGNRTEEIDLVVEGYSAEIKTASLGANGTFQFNHIRLDRDYEFLICIGICPDEIVFNMWTGEDVHSESAGHLVRMAQDQAVTYKLTKLRGDMRPIDGFISAVQSLLGL